MSESNKKYSLLDSNSEDIRRGTVRVEKKPLPSREKEKKKNRRLIYILSVVGVSIILACVILPSMLFAVNEMLVFELKINETDITYHEDGVYSATYKNAHMSATVSVTIISGRMYSISLDSYTGIDPARADEVFERVIYYQMLNIPSEDSAEIFSEVTDYIVLEAISLAISGESSSASSGSGVNV